MGLLRKQAHTSRSWAKSFFAYKNPDARWCRAKDKEKSYHCGMKTQKPTPAQPHSGISMHRIRVGGDSMGLLAALGAILVCVVGFPQARGFLVISIVVGLVAALAFRVWHQRRPSDVDRLSILTKEETVSAKSKKEPNSTTGSLLCVPITPLAN